MNKDKKKIVVIIASILLVLVLIIGASFALSIFEKASDANLIKTGSISMHYTESSNVINITNALPMSDRDGEMQSNYFDFSITSDAKTNADDSVGITIPYDLIIEPKAIDTDKDALSPEQIKIFLTKIENGVEETVIASTLLSNLELKETNYNLYSTENVHKNGSSAITTKYRLRAWIDYNVDAKDWGKSAKPKQYKFAINVNGRQKIVEPTAAETLTAKVGTGGLVAESHPATEQLAATTAYRYTGKDPDNYVSFNNELWRIIGVFDVDDGTGNLEKRIKLIRNESLTSIEWDDVSDDSYTSDWQKASSRIWLNSSYFINLTEESKFMVDDAKWYLGGTNQRYVNATQFYSYERGINVDSGNSVSWVGKVGLMYPSDYGYATSGGTTENRDTCLTKVMSLWNSSYSDCRNNDWLHNSTSQWTMTPYSGTYAVYYVEGTGIMNNHYVYDTYWLRPSIYLKSDIEISGGSGTDSDPYQLSLSSPNSLDQPKTTSDFVNLVGYGGLVEESHPSTDQLQATTDYRYAGANPDNYVSFNNELWRIIGIFNVDDGTGNVEQRIKLIRNESIGNVAWDSNSKNDWTTATGMTLLNSGDYWNRTGSYASNGLTEEAKNLITDAKWYLGGTPGYRRINTTQFYSYERGTTVYSGRPTSWVGKVGLMYPSDYGYATSGGTPTNRTSCLAQEMYVWKDSTSSDCKNNDWLHNSSFQWTLAPYSGDSSSAFYMGNSGGIDSRNVNGVITLRPTVFLKSDIQITGGSGTESAPYTLSK